MEVFVAQLVNGLSVGAVYALIVLGTNLVLVVRGVLHFAYAHSVVIGVYAAWYISETSWGSMPVALAGGFAASAALVMASEPVFRPLAVRRASIETIIVALGLAIVLTELPAQFLHNGRPVGFPEILSSGPALGFGLVTISLGHMFALAAALAAVVALNFVLYRTEQGRACRAVAMDLDSARLLGLPITRTGLFSFALAGALAGLTSILLIETVASAEPTLGGRLAIKAIVLALAAGPGNLLGGVALALMVGVGEALALAYLPGQWSEAIVFGGIMVVILFRPQGLFGARV